MNELLVFENPEFGRIFAQKDNGQTWLKGKDLAEALGYVDTDKAIRMRVHEDDKLPRQFSGAGQMREAIFVNESGMYSLILSSKLPKAKAFKHWVTSEVLPSIRETGGYAKGNEMDFIIRATVAETTKALLEQLPTIIAAVAGALRTPGSEAEPKSLPLPPIGSTCKMDTFPPEVVRQANAIIDAMEAQKRTNISYIVRFMAAHGCDISCPAVKRYYDRRVKAAE